MGIWEGLKRGAASLAKDASLVKGDGPACFAAGGKQIACEHCGHEAFVEGRALLNTFGMTFLGLDWANQSATTLMCDRCGRIQWYGVPPERQ